ncbi:hypothetical protein CDA63_06295 [Hymenobacter amundsenii]|uniref:TonB C-terminal domain-containing protein n=1 Tax=Hymenobacter amundsenii TaxID=2006685 RepID=A0A246FMW4_9BACT|nr:TonB family protein [Hymenobacter amundsenii]OWP64070.1 hypothetical protein CDA63_06295 [Hymenobacter amundsenii]
MLLLLLLPGLPAVAQSSYNRWEALPVAAPPPSTKGHQDSLRRAELWAKSPLVKRGISQPTRNELAAAKATGYAHFVGNNIKWPIEALKAQTEGVITLRLAVDEAGNVLSAQVVGSTVPAGAVGEAALQEEARRVFRQLRFEPAAGATEEEVKVSFIVQ